MMKKKILFLSAMAAGLVSFGQASWAPNGSNTLFSRNASYTAFPISVGIGLNNPYSLLQVHSTGGDNQVVVSGTAPSIRFQALSSIPSAFGVPYAKIGLSTVPNHFCVGSTAGDLVIQTMDSTKSIIFSNKYTRSGNGVEQMRLNASGFLGIGTPSPETKLHVRDGDISIDRNKSIIFGSTANKDGNGEYIRNSRDLARQGMPDSIYGLSFFAGYLERIRINYSDGYVGIGTTAPNARLEIKDGRQNQSGLRFTNLTSNSPTRSNPGKVLSLNASGDVILVPSGNGPANANNGLLVNGTNIQLGRVCEDDGNRAADLSDNRAIPLNNHNVIFKDAIQGAAENANNRIGIGYFTNRCELQAKLQVEKQETTVIEDASIGILSHNSDAMDYHVRDERIYDETIAVKGIADAAKGMVNIGGDFSAKTELQGIGVRATVEGTPKTWAAAGVFSVPVSLQATGVQAFVSGQNYAIGVEASAVSEKGPAIGGQFRACGTNSIGIYAEACNSFNNGAGPSYAGFFNGDVFTTSPTYYGSDRRLKKDIQPISNALELLGKIEPKKYQFDNSKYPSLHLPTQQENYGVIAQELEVVMPSLVKDVPVPGAKGFTGESIKSVNYIELIPVLIQAVKDQQKQIEELKAMITSKDNASATVNEAITKINVALSDKNAMVLGQNAPNPFAKSTAIAFNLPETVQHASIKFASADGRSLKSVEIGARGRGVITIYASELSSGIYLYTLVADGKIVETKKMQIIR